jgi:hypothetical protein
MSAAVDKPAFMQRPVQGDEYFGSADLRRPGERPPEELRRREAASCS